MLFENVSLAAFGHALPTDVVTSDELEERLAPVYDRLHLSVGRLELMSGIRERRFFPPGTRPSTVAARAGAKAIEASGVPRESIGCLIHASVCRDFMEPATASVVHDLLELPPTCTAFDLSNACLGFANAMMVVGGMIEHGEIDAGLVVAGEDGGPLVEETVRTLTEGADLGRREVKQAYASLTIGAGAAGAVLVRASVHPGGRRLIGGTALAATEHNALCSGDRTDGSGPLMDTDSEALLLAGNALAVRTWARFTEELGWAPDSIDRIVTHQVGAAHRRQLFETLGLDLERDFPTYATLGNMGSVSLPATFALAEEAGFIESGHRVAMLGIGSGLHCLMLGLE